MFLRIETIIEKKLVGCFIRMSFQNNKTKELWQGFMPKKRLIKNIIGTDLISAEVYDDGFFDNFNPLSEFEKWAAVEVTEKSTPPEGFSFLLIPSGKYAVFLHKGPAIEGPKTYHYIFNHWFPGSGFKLDTRPHFSVMGEKYKQDDIDSEEEIWIPVMLDAGG